MAAKVLKNASVTVNGTDLSDHVRSVTVNYGAAEVDSTVMNPDGAEEVLPGLTNWSLDVEFRQDYAVGEVDDTLFALVGADPFAVVVLPENAVLSASNPSYSGNAILTSYTPLQGSPGDLITAPVTLRGTGVLARATS